MTLASYSSACSSARTAREIGTAVSADSRNLHTPFVVLKGAGCCALAQVIVASCRTLCQNAKRFWCQDAKRVGARCHRAW